MDKSKLYDTIKTCLKEGISSSGMAYLIKQVLKEEEKEEDNTKKKEKEKVVLKGEKSDMQQLGNRYDKNKQLSEKKPIVKETIEDSLKLLGAGDAHFFCLEFVREDAGKNKALAGVATVINVNTKEEAEKAASALIPEPIKLLKVCSPTRLKDSIYLIDGKNKKAIEV